MEEHSSCVYDSQGAFACPGRDAYKASRDAQQRQYKRDSAWVDSWVKVENEAGMQYVVSRTDAGVPTKTTGTRG